MKKLKIDKKTITDRINTIQDSLEKLGGLKALTAKEFLAGENFAIAEHYLRYALEATFDICSHILSRIPGARVGEYKEMALEMGRKELLPLDFSEKALYEMGGYRNRLTHFYHKVRPNEIYKIIQNDLGDFEIFLKFVKKILA